MDLLKHRDSQPPAYSLVDPLVVLHLAPPQLAFENEKVVPTLLTLEEDRSNRIPWEAKKTRFRDWLFIPLFFIVFAGLISISNASFQHVYQLHQQRLNFLWHNMTQSISLTNIVMLCALTIVVGLFLGFLQLIGLMFFYKTFIVGVLTINCAVGSLLAFYFYQQQQYYLMIFVSLFTIAILLISWKLHKKILFSTQIIKIGSRLLRSTPSLWVVYLCMLIINTSFMCFYFTVLFTSFLTWKDEPDKQLKYGIAAFLIFTGYYLTEIFQNSIQVIVGTIVAKWYFLSNVDTLHTIYNTFMKCFGSVCFGSLFASVLRIFKEAITLTKPGDQIIKHPLLKPIWKLLEWIIIGLNYTIQYFNQYAYAYISIYSKGYIKSSYRLFKIYNLKGYDTLISECIIKIILKLYIIFTGITAGIIAYFCIELAQSNYMLNRQCLWVLVIISSLLAMQISRMISMIINAYVHVLFLCLIQHRNIMQWTHPDEYACIAPYLPPQPPFRPNKMVTN